MNEEKKLLLTSDEVATFVQKKYGRDVMPLAIFPGEVKNVNNCKPDIPVWQVKFNFKEEVFLTFYGDEVEETDFKISPLNTGYIFPEGTAVYLKEFSAEGKNFVAKMIPGISYQDLRIKFMQ